MKIKYILSEIGILLTVAISFAQAPKNIVFSKTEKDTITGGRIIPRQIL